MVYKRRRPTMKPRRKTVRRRMARIPRSVKPKNALSVKRTFWREHWTPNTTTTNGFWRYYQFTPDLIPNWADYTSIFDQYKVNALRYTFRPRYDNYSGNDTTDTTVPGITNAFDTRIYVVNDPYSTIGPTGTYSLPILNSFLEQGNVKMYKGGRDVNVYFKPSINLATEAGNNMRRRASWLNVTNNNAHNGFHIFLHDSNFAAIFAQSYDVFITAYMTFRNQR